MENDRGTTTLDPNGSTQYPAQDANSSSSTKRRREARERVRVSRACDRCKRYV